jgi:hypothetical protein
MISRIVFLRHDANSTARRAQMLFFPPLFFNSSYDQLLAIEAAPNNEMFKKLPQFSFRVQPPSSNERVCTTPSTQNTNK